ncbi:thiamine pyrophosphokinase [Lysinibacillus sp. PLM2]|nr:thiamine pyrophosphokinase [Lysinibacillus sp. PLM2]
MSTVIICSGGPKSDIPSLDTYLMRDKVYFIGADKGSIYLLEQGIQPNEIVGDFDSLTNEQWLNVSSIVKKITKVQAEKDETDTDLALEKALEYHPTEIILTGVTGGRLDHFEAAIRSVYRLQSTNLHIQIKILNISNEIRFLFPGKHILTKSDQYRYLSFFAYEQDVKDVCLSGVKYETTNQVIELGSSRFTSNELNCEFGYISFSSGICLMIRSSD